MNNKQQMQIDKMGYDRSITMFSPDGRLLQVEYAKKTVRQGSTAIGVVCKDGVLIVADKRIVENVRVRTVSWRHYDVERQSRTGSSVRIKTPWRSVRCLHVGTGPENQS